MIIDIHAHVCDTLAAITQGEPLRSLRYGLAQIGNRKVQFFPPSFENSNSPVEALIAQMNASGVDKALLMANPYYGYTNDYFIESVNKYPDRLKGIALVDLLKGKEAAEELEAHKATIAEKETALNDANAVLAEKLETCENAVIANDAAVENLENATTNLENAKTDKEQAEANLEAANQTVEQAEKDLAEKQKVLNEMDEAVNAAYNELETSKSEEVEAKANLDVEEENVVAKENEVNAQTELVDDLTKQVEDETKDVEDIYEWGFTNDPWRRLGIYREKRMPAGTQMVPRVFKTNVGDIFTTNTIDEKAEDLTVGKILVPGKTNGILVLSTNANADAQTDMKWQVVKVYTMPDNQAGVKIMRIA